jgi:transcriptional regulator with XRE-family HTH domain
MATKKPADKQSARSSKAERTAVSGNDGGSTPPVRAMTQAEKLDALGIDTVASRIEAGETQAELARSIGVDVGTLNRWLHSDPQRSARAREAMTVSAEAMQDRGLDALLSAPPDNAEIARARALEQHWARRAAIRNPRHSQKLAIGGDADAPPIRTESTVTITAEEAYKRMLNGE